MSEEVDEPIDEVARELRAAIAEAPLDGGHPLGLAFERLVLAVVDAWAHHPKWRHGDMERHLVKQYGCSRVRAEEAIRQARLILQERAADPSLTDRVVAAYMLDLERCADCYAKCMADGDRRTALAAVREHARTLQMMSKHLGLTAPERVEVTTTVSVREERFAELTTEQLELLAKVTEITAQETTIP